MDQSSTEKNERIAIEIVRDHAWDYFALHAEQRLKTFHFFIMLETALVAAMLFAARTVEIGSPVLLTVGLLMVVLSFVFWKLDQRTKGMIKASEEALKLFETKVNQMLSQHSLEDVLPFLNDPQNKGKVGLSPFGVLSYSKCFGIVFLSFGLLGLGIVFRAVTGAS